MFCWERNKSNEKGTHRGGCLFSVAAVSAALMHRRVHLRDIDRRADPIQPLMVLAVRLRGTREADHGCGQTTCDHCGKSELLHLRAFFCCSAGASFFPV